MVTITEIIGKVRELAARHPEAMYQGAGGNVCSYTRGNVANGPTAEGCIFGHALHALGLEIPDHHDTDSITDVLDELQISYSLFEQDWVQEVQSVQDRKYAWGYAVEYADEQIPLPAETSA